jgi:plastocyanin
MAPGRINKDSGRLVIMAMSHAGFAKRSRVQWAAALGLAATLALPVVPAAAQPELQTGPVASTGADCAIQLSVANPNPGDQEIPHSLAMSGTALDSTATSGVGISQIEAFLGNRDDGGLLIGTTSLAAPAGSWTLTATIPANMSGGQDLFVYGTSSVSGQEAFVSIPVVVGEALPNISVSNVAESFCPTVVTPAAPVNPPVAAPAPQPAPPLPQPIAPPTPQPAPPAPQPAPPANSPAAVPAPAPVQLNISSPASPALTFDTNTLTAPAGAQVTLTYANNSPIPHNWHLFNGPDSSGGTIAATRIMPGPGASDSVSFTAPSQAGSYFFWCDVHPTIMTGHLVLN